MFPYENNGDNNGCKLNNVIHPYTFGPCAEVHRCYYDVVELLLRKIIHNDITWAIQNLQSNNEFAKVTAMFITQEYNK
jgi:hypothetical protein